MQKAKRDYIALQNIWFECAMAYLHSINFPELRFQIINDWRDSLVDMEIDTNKAIRSIYKTWEEDTWIPMCRYRLVKWIQNNPFDAKVEKNKEAEFQFIKLDLNYLRYEKIMQVIQDSGIGLGQVSSSSSGGYYVGPKNVNRFTQ